MECGVELDRRMLDYVVGLDTELEEMLDSASCYQSTVRLDSVVLPDQTKKLVLNTVENFEKFKELREKMGFGDIVKYGKGLVVLFYGESGTGKTMLANALACHLKRKILLIKMAALQDVSSDTFRLIFREARIQNAIVFFDECEGLFESRSNSRSSVGVALVELEQYDGMVLMATNRAMDLDEAMHRRISLSIEFPAPDHELRRKIWLKHIPTDLKIEADLDFSSIALEFELTGGFIKNAVLQALSLAVGRSNQTNKDAVVSEDDIREACRLQSRGRLQMSDLESRTIPDTGLAHLVLTLQAEAKLRDAIEFERARRVLTTRWGFGRDCGANVLLLHGPPGCGKSSAASAVAFEVGRPIQEIGCGELLKARAGSTNGGLSLFRDCELVSAVIVLENAELLIKCLDDSHGNSVIAEDIMLRIRSYQGIILLCATSSASTLTGWNPTARLPPALASVLRHTISFPPPTPALRLRLWRLLLPARLPTAPSVPAALPGLAERHAFSGRSTILRAAARCAVRGEGESVGAGELEEACEVEEGLIGMAEWGVVKGDAGFYS